MSYHFDNLWIPLFTIPVFIFFLHKVYLVKKNYQKTTGVCINTEETYNRANKHTRKLYRGTYKYLINNKEYITAEKDYMRTRKPKLNKEVNIYVGNDNPNDIVTTYVMERYYFVIIAAVIITIFGGLCW